MLTIAYSPNGSRIISGSQDGTVRIWDAEIGAAIGRSLKGHTDTVWSVAYSPDGQHIISGSADRTIRIWDAETGTGFGKTLEWHTGDINSVVCSPNGQHIISSSADRTIRIWDANTGAAFGKPLMAHTDGVYIACSPDGRHIVSGSWDTTIHVWDLFPRPPTQSSTSYHQTHPDFFAQPDANGWVRDSMDGLLYWVPPDCRAGLHSSALITIPPMSHTRFVGLDFEDFVFGSSWTQIFNSADP